MMNKLMKKIPLIKTQNKLLKISLKQLLGKGLIEETTTKRPSHIKSMVLKDALNAIVLNS